MNEVNSQLIHVASIDEFEDEEMIPVEVNGNNILICRVDDSFCAVSNICSHEYAELSDGELDGCLVTCPLHFSEFNVCTGKVQSPPATEPLKTYKLTVIDENIYVEL